MSLAMDDSELLRLLEVAEAEDILASVLTNAETEALSNIKHELGLCVRWGAFTQQMLDGLLSSVDALVFLEEPKSDSKVVKRNPYDALFDRDKALINGSSEKSKLLRRYVLLQLAKKLLGSLKTQINQELKSFRHIDEDTEMELRAVMDEGPDEEEMDSVGEQKPGKVVGTVHLGEDRGCAHHRTTVRQVRANAAGSKREELRTVCKDCRQVIRIKVLESPTERGLTRRSREDSKWPEFLEPAECVHPRVRWKAGQEGRIAICSKCDEEVPEPEKYEWSSVGLEPYGDDPDSDEIICLSNADGAKEATA